MWILVYPHEEYVRIVGRGHNRISQEIEGSDILTVRSVKAKVISLRVRFNVEIKLRFKSDALAVECIKVINGVIPVQSLSVSSLSFWIGACNMDGKDDLTGLFAWLCCKDYREIIGQYSQPGNDVYVVTSQDNPVSESIWVSRLCSGLLDLTGIHYEVVEKKSISKLGLVILCKPHLLGCFQDIETQGL